MTVTLGSSVELTACCLWISTVSNCYITDFFPLRLWLIQYEFLSRELVSLNE